MLAGLSGLGSDAGSSPSWSNGAGAKSSSITSPSGDTGLVELVSDGGGGTGGETVSWAWTGYSCRSATDSKSKFDRKVVVSLPLNFDAADNATVRAGDD